MTNEECIKRIIKCYLHFKGEASSKELITHIENVGYGIHKKYTAKGLTYKIKYWARASKSGSWFKVECYVKNNVTYWRLRK